MKYLAAKTNYKQFFLVDGRGSCQIFTYYPDKDRVHRFREQSRVAQILTKQEADQIICALTVSGWLIDRATGIDVATDTLIKWWMVDRVTGIERTEQWRQW